MLRTAAIGLVGLALAGGGYLEVTRVQAAGPPAAGRQAAAPPQRGDAPPHAPVTPPDRALLDKYCVTCHNEKLKTGDLMLDKVDVANLAASSDVLEKIVRKLRNGQMPPE